MAADRGIRASHLDRENACPRMMKFLKPAMRIRFLATGEIFLVH
jgi:hypothetical protein